MTKVCHISTVHSQGDPRIFHKQCKSLAEHGYDVSLIVQFPKNEILEGISIIGLPTGRKRIGRILLGFKAFRLGLKTKAKLIHFHDPELIWMGVWFRIFGRKVIFDVHEDVAKQILDKTWLGPKWLRRLVSWTYKTNEKICTLFFSGIVTATEGIAEQFPSKKSIAIFNYPDLRLIENAEAPDIKTNKPVAIYAGGLTEIRGIYELIDAVGLLDGEVELWLIGTWENTKFEEKCKTNKGFKFTRYFGVLPLKIVYGYYKLATIGVNVPYPLKRHMTAIPTKIVECMGLGIPTVMTGDDYLKKFFSDHAIFISEYNSKKIAEGIHLLVTDKNRWNEISIEAKKMVKERMCWEIEAKRLIAFYAKLLS